MLKYVDVCGMQDVPSKKFVEMLCPIVKIQLHMHTTQNETFAGEMFPV